MIILLQQVLYDGSGKKVSVGWDWLGSRSEWERKVRLKRVDHPRTARRHPSFMFEPTLSCARQIAEISQIDLMSLIKAYLKPAGSILTIDFIWFSNDRSKPCRDLQLSGGALFESIWGKFVHPRIEIKLLIFVVSSEDGDALVVMEQERRRYSVLRFLGTPPVFETAAFPACILRILPWNISHYCI